MLLVCDIGNTNITLGIFDNKTIIQKIRLASGKELTKKEYEDTLYSILKDYKIDGCIIASVVEHLDEILKEAIDNIFKINSMILTNDLNIGIKLKLKNPNEVGADRIANAYGAHILYKKPTIVVDLGTATTFDILDKNGDFLGGVIMPGISLQLHSLKSNTSKLPSISAKYVSKSIGNNTVDAMLSGVIRGSACAIEGLIKQCESELKEKAQIIATGGDSELISKYMERKFDYVNPNLTLEGLKFLYNLNNTN